MASVVDHNIMATKCDSYEDYLAGKCEGNEQVVFGDEVTKGAVGKYYFNISLSDQ